MSNILPISHTVHSFQTRHIGITPAEQEKMLAICGTPSLDGLMDETIPSHIRQQTPLNLPAPLSEAEFLQHIQNLGMQNTHIKDMIGQGYYGCFLPEVIKRNLLENPGWYTAYTPYQPEISQGRLEAILNFQTMVRDLTGMEIAGASLLDEATAAAEAMTLAKRQSKNKSNGFFVASNVHPQTLEIIRARAIPLGYELHIDCPSKADIYDVFGAIFQYPATDGTVTDYTDIIACLKAKGAICAVATDLLALTILKTPAEMGADIAFGSSQRFGVPMGFGGPHAAFFACHDAFKRNMPGRLVGVSVDSQGNPAYRLTLQTREQHIRREKATSNICTAQVLLAVIAGMYACYHGKAGLQQIAETTHQKACLFAHSLKDTAYQVKNLNFFDTVVIATGTQTHTLLKQAEIAGYNLRLFDDQHLAIAFDETVTAQDIQNLTTLFAGKAITLPTAISLPHLPKRQSDYLTHPVFNRYQNETAMMRYLRGLMDKDLALDKAMIPLGSCTMKLNSATEMFAVTMPAFANVHPLRPLSQVSGYLQMIESLEDMLATITGFDAVSLQPNSGAAGELAGLMAIRGYHLGSEDTHRNICLIPASAHGTNPASAVMAGMQVVVVNCDDSGNIDVADLKAKAEQHQQALAALMVTYPSTHGVFEEAIQEICEIIHAHGGQVYMDGANMNAQVGLTSPALIGADVCHLNLHKTFCIPHGGGGPGVGPIGVKSHLAPYLPGHLHLKDAPARHQRSYYPIAAAPFGSASILCISYAYILMMGAVGVTESTKIAILSANYIASRLKNAYPVLYANPKGRVAHECILDTRIFKDRYGVSVDDIAKRLADYGFHAPTMSFPVSGTLMIEPTESEPLSELDRFCDAMLAIHKEMHAIEEGVYDHAHSPLAHAPHTESMVLADQWDKPYSRMQAAFPLGKTMMVKYWPAAARVDHVYGDRNVICACPDIADYEY